MTLAPYMKQQPLNPFTTEVHKKLSGDYDVFLGNPKTKEGVSMNCHVPTEDIANAVSESVMSLFRGQDGKTTAPKAKRKIPKVKLTKQHKEQIAYAAMGLDRERAVKFLEDINTLGIVAHIMANIYDDLCYFFDDITSTAIKQTYANAERDITKLLNAVDAVIRHDDQETADEKGRTPSELIVGQQLLLAEFLRDRLNIVANHCADKETIWRLDELDNTLNRIITADNLKERRDILYSEARKRIGID